MLKKIYKTGFLGKFFCFLFYIKFKKNEIESSRNGNKSKVISSAFLSLETRAGRKKKWTRHSHTFRSAVDHIISGRHFRSFVRDGYFV